MSYPGNDHFQRLLALFHYCSLYHSGKNSREYAVLSRVTGKYGFRPSGSEEYAECLTDDDNFVAREIFLALGGSYADFSDDVPDGYESCPHCGFDHSHEQAAAEREHADTFELDREVMAESNLHVWGEEP